MPSQLWNKKALMDFLKPVDDWAKTQNIPANRIYVAEFGVNRRVPGAAAYLSDLLDLFEERQWHWGFYSFREDGFPAMDYEMGPRATLPEDYWKSEAKGEFPSRTKWYRKNPLWESLKAHLAKP